VPSDPSTAVDNSLLAGLPRRDWRRLVGHCEPVNLVFGDILCEPGDRFGHVHFPLSGFISVVATLDAQQPLEMGLIGSEGMLGATLMLGVDTAPMRAVVRGPGSALRMSRAGFRRQLEASSALRRQLARYLYVLMYQLAKSSACTHFHQTSPRLARWLLMTHDRAHANHFHLTHAFLADMLGVRRSSVSLAAAEMQRGGLIAYSRGEITILDRAALERAACPCYEAERADYARLSGPGSPRGT